MIPATKQFGMEAMAYRTKQDFLPKLKKIFERVINDDTGRKAAALQKEEIPKLVKDTFGISIILSIVHTNRRNMYAVPPDLKKNHVLLNSWRQEFFTAQDAIRYLNGSKLKSIQGGVSRSQGIIFGDFTNIVSEVVFDISILDGFMTPDEVAEGFAHELGHIWSAFEFLSLTMSTNLALAAATPFLTGEQSPDLNYKLITALGDATGTQVPKAKEISHLRSTEALLTVVVNEVYKQTLSSREFGSLYDATSWESQSDMFVTRLGGGRAVVTALDKLHREANDPTYMPDFRWYMWQSVSVMLGLTVFLPITMAIFFIYVSSGLHPAINDYDSLRDRCERIRRDLIGSLRSSNLPKEVLDATLADIDTIEKTMAGMIDRTPIITSIMVTLWNPFRKQAKEKELQQLLEKLVNNDLVLTSAKFKSTL